jgi:hypothetical protein
MEPRYCPGLQQSIGHTSRGAISAITAVIVCISTMTRSSTNPTSLCVLEKSATAASSEAASHHEFGARGSRATTAVMRARL